MDTNLKKSKLINAFIYRLIMVCAFVTMIATGLFGREALFTLNQEGDGILTGDVYYLTEFREYMATQFQNYMIGRVGIADDLGYPLTDKNTNHYEAKYLDQFNQALADASDALVFQYQQLGSSLYRQFQTGNIDAPLFSQNDGHLLENNNYRIAVYWDGPQGVLYFFDRIYHIPSAGANYLANPDYTPSWEAASSVRFILGYKEAALYQYKHLGTMCNMAESFQYILILFITSGVLAAVFGILSLFTCKRLFVAIKLYGSYSSKILMEIKLLLLVFDILLYLIFDLNYTLADLEYRLNIYPDLWLYYPLTALIYLLWLDIRYAPKQCLTNSILYKVIRALKDFSSGTPWKRKLQRSCVVLLFSMLVTLLAIALVVYPLSYYAYPVMMCTMFGLFALFIWQCSSFLKLHRFIQDTDAILTKLEDLSMGHCSCNIQLNPKTLLTESALALENLQNGIEKAVEQENKANRMRVELITNVSHDLKTPLTSIINYADLLSEEELAAPAAEYVDALRSKAYRLKKMVQNVFDLSKATTGNLPVRKNKLDMAKLIKQTLADMDEELQNSSLDFRLKISSEPLYIMADGEKMYRVFQNLLVNAMQYSLTGSRVHIILDEQDGFAVAQIKNISKEEIHFTPDEIVERFVRADSSRTNEGSGLGLSIVQSFTQACGGEFFIHLDADLFTACIRFPLISEEEEGRTDEQTIEEI